MGWNGVWVIVAVAARCCCLLRSHADLQELQAVKREVLQLKRERDDLHQQYEESVLTIRQLRESAPGACVSSGWLASGGGPDIALSHSLAEGACVQARR